MSAVPFKSIFNNAFPEDERTATAADLTSIENRLMPKMAHLTAADKKRMTRLGTASMGHVGLCFGYANDNPQFRTGYLDMNAWKIDMDALAYLTSLTQRLDRLSQAAEDTLILAGFEAYEMARIFYAALKTAVATGQPGAAAIYADLARHYAKRPAQSSVAVDPSLAPAAPSAAAPGSSGESESEAPHQSFFEPPPMHE